MTTASESLTKFHWEPQPAAQKLLDGLVAEFLTRCPDAATLAEQMKEETGTRFKDWIDFIQAPRSDDLRARLLEAGFVKRALPGAPECYVHPGAIFPMVIMQGDVAAGATRIGIKVDSVADFLATRQLCGTEVIGEPLSRLRMGRVYTGTGASVWVVERHGWQGFEPPEFDAARAIKSLKHAEAFRRRERNFETDDHGLDRVHTLVDAAVKDLGRDWACALFFAAEREYWQRRNRAAQVQKARQDKLGLGWANHDHHTYRCSRHNFVRLVSLWEKLGLECRESFYAGAEAGWGAQVMEQPVAGITTFNDVDLSPEELLGDFAHILLKERESLGTVGLWVGLHGEAVLQAGMHHLECQFDFHSLVHQLEHDAHVKTMAPFTKLPYLRQAFTEGEIWEVAAARIDALLASGMITRRQADQFRAAGAIGSHLENLERNDGFKGFNQTGVSDIIERTDPRRQVELSGA